MNPSLAVKQYSRSSADQEVPLPHELRPVNVLRMTMSYLMYKIMNLCDSVDVNFAEWYHFLWDRTRGIRKDITQQELCSIEAVELVEQCARFHIHCSARLVAEDPSVFDQKINTENLTKCLQTLKYMYHDLELKGVYCKNEAEFRAYIILLNLNDGNFMWEMQQLRHEIQNSPEIHFALQVYSALDKNNYVRFFKLVHSSTYLNACILLRYFVQVRLSALKVILKCFSPRQPHKSYPLGELTDILAFESVEATVDFLSYHGLVLSEDGTHVILDRRLFGMPEYPYSIDRAINVIESKRSCSVGELVAGGGLTASLHENHVPQNSFDATGRINVTEILAELNITVQDDLVEKEDRDQVDSNQEKAAPASIFVSERSKSPMLMNENSKTATADTIFGGATAKIEEKSVSSAAQTKTFEQFKFVVHETKVQNYQPIKTVAFNYQPQKTIEVPIFASISQSEKTIEPKKPAFNYQDTETFEESTPAFGYKIKEPTKTTLKKDETPKIIEEPPNSDIIAQRKREAEALKQQQLQQEKEHREALEKQKEIKRQKQAEIKAAVAVTIDFLLNYVEEKQRQTRLEELALRVRNRKARKFFKIWQDTARTKQKKRKAVDYCFAWLMPRTRKEEVAELKTHSQFLVLSDMKRYKLGKTIDIPIPKLRLPQKINIHEICYNRLLSSLGKAQIKFPKELFWKISISLVVANKTIHDTLNAAIGWKQNSDGTTFLVEQNKTVNQNVTYCLENQKGVCKTDSNALIFISKDLNENLQTLICNIQSQFGRNVVTPTAIILLNTAANQTENLETLKISKIFHGANLPVLLEDSLKFLAENYQKPPPLELDTLQSFLSLYLAGDIWKRISGLSKWNSSYRNCLKNPRIAIKIHNDNLDKIKELLFDVSRKEFAEFPQIFHEHLISALPDYLPCDFKYFPKNWQSTTYETLVKNTIDRFYLSDYANSWPPPNEEILEQNMYAYCQNNFDNPQKAFYKLMSIILKDVDPEDNFENLRNFLWTDLVEAMAVEKISEINFAFCDPQSVFNQLFVVYNTESLSRYRASSWFYVNYPPIREEIKNFMVSNQGRIIEAKKRKSSERFSLELDMDLDEMLAKVTKSFVDDEEKRLQRQRDIKQIKTSMSDLKESLGIQKKINATLQERLMFALEEKK